MWVDLRRFSSGLVWLVWYRMDGGKWGLWGGRMEWILYTILGSGVKRVLLCLGWVDGLIGKCLKVELFDC